MLIREPFIADQILQTHLVYCKGCSCKHLLLEVSSAHCVTKFILREPQEVDSSSDPHELTQWAWLVPTFSMLIITGLLYEEFILGSKSQPETVDEEGAVDETSKLVAKKQQDRRRSSIAEINQAFSPEYEVNGRVSSQTNRQCFIKWYHL